MNDLDEQLSALAMVEAPGGLDGLEQRVLGAIAERRFAARMAGYVAAGALTIGVASAMLPPRQAVAAPIDPVSGLSPLAPSALLLE
ncbi:hypothetical protein [Sphingomonas sp. 37zxx]|uniref:hypothetical protein n=1 Tax=Sphingomonas sp. 37zxx TaxID=1550073 RepID=UPI00053BFFC0|nr:hypothetical protein [Sphingomonas sp. 37zxx]